MFNSLDKFVSYYSKLIKVELQLNEKVTVNVINKEEEPKITINDIETEISVEESKSEIEVQNIENKHVKANVKLPKTGM